MRHRTRSPQLRAKTAAFVSELRTRIVDLLEGREGRDATGRWAREVSSPRHVFGDAGAVLESLTSADEFENGEPLIRRQELEAYLRWLTEGPGFWGDELPLVCIRRPLDSLDAADATEAIRFWESSEPTTPMRRSQTSSRCSRSSPPSSATCKRGCRWSRRWRSRTSSLVFDWTLLAWREHTRPP